jgi:hypothetical protein
MRLLHLWLTSLSHPSQAFEEFKHKPAPQWGLYASLGRCAFIVLVWYLPLSLLGLSPSWPSYLTFVPTERYYAASVLIFPIYNLAFWLLSGSLFHVILRLGKRNSDIDQILNLGGIVGLVFQPVISLLDWAGVILGWQSMPVVMGITHLVIDLWVIVWMAKGFKQLLGLPIWWGAGLTLLATIMNVPLAILFLRG